MYLLCNVDEYGGTTVDYVISAAKVYLKSLGYEYDYGNYWLDLYSDFKRDVKKDQASFLGFGAKVDGEVQGHDVLVVGYVESTEAKYLKVADGWRKYLRYLNYDLPFSWYDGGTFYAK